MTIANCLTSINNTKQEIATSINNKGGSITSATPFADYAAAIDNLPSGGSAPILFDTWYHIAGAGNGDKERIGFRAANTFQEYLEKLISATDFSNPNVFSCAYAFWATCYSNTIQLPTRQIGAIAAGFDLDFNNAQLGSCKYFQYMFGANTTDSNYKGKILNLDLSSAENVTGIFQQGGGIREITLKGSFGGNSSVATLDLDISSCSGMQTLAMEQFLLSIQANNSGNTRNIKLSNAQYVQVQGYSAMMQSKGYNLITA